MRPLSAIALILMTAALATAVLGVPGLPRAHAADANPSGNAAPGSAAAPTANSGTPPGGNDIQVSAYFTELYKVFLAFVGISALFAFVVGGVMYVFSGAVDTTSRARQWIWNGILGIIIAATAVLLLRTINPDLVQGFDLEKMVQGIVPPPPSPP